MISVTRSVCATNITLVFRSLTKDEWRLAKHSFAGICHNSSLKVVYYRSQDKVWADFEILCVLVTRSPRHKRSFTKIKSYPQLCTYAKEDSSAWTEVCASTYRTRSTITASRGKSDKNNCRRSNDGLWRKPLSGAKTAKVVHQLL